MLRSFDYISDIHLDMFLPSDMQQNIPEKKFEEPMKHLGVPRSSILLIAGDLGHYNQQNIEFLQFLRKYYYEHIVLVLGNHDMWLWSGNQKKKWKNTEARLEDFREKVAAEQGVYLLECSTVTINGMTIAGDSMWYDYSMVKAKEEAVAEWAVENLRDMENIIPPVDLFGAKIRNEKFFRFVAQRNPDVIMTHFVPIPAHLGKYAQRESSGMYGKAPDLDDLFRPAGAGFDVRPFVPFIQGKTWVHGHSHMKMESCQYSCTFLTNAYGYYKHEKTNPIATW